MWGRRLPGKRKQMPAFIGREPERLGNTFQHLCRRMDITPLLQPDVPGGADTGKLRDLFAAQPRRSSPEARRQPNISGSKVRPPLAQKVCKGLATLTLLHLGSSSFW